MAFIDKIDYAAVIRTNILDDITEVDDTKIDACEERAIERVKGYLNNRYDVVTIFAQTGAARHPLVLMYTMDITLYYLHRLINYRKVPMHRAEAYKEAMDWLEKVSEQKINPPNLPFLTTDDKDYIRWGSNTKRNNQI